MAAGRPDLITNSATYSRTRILNFVWVAALIGGIAFLMLFHLDRYPGPWYDEGAFMKVAKNFAHNGIYADYSSEGNRFLGPVISTGPTLILPMSLLFSIFGVSVFAARLVGAVYACLTLALLFMLGRRLAGNWQTGALVVLLLFTTPDAQFHFFGRMAVGEIVGIFFMLAAVWLWLRPERLKLGQLAAVGALFGLACMTKSQYAIFILPALLAAWIADLVWYRQRHWSHFVIPGVVAGIVTFGWLFFAIALLGGPGTVTENWTAFRLAGENAFEFDLASMRRSMDFMTGQGIYGGLFLAAVIYSLLLALPRTPEGQNNSMLLLLLAGSAAMYIISIPDWTRYALPAVTLGALLLAHLLTSLIGKLPRQRLEWRGLLSGQALTNATLLVMVLGSAVIVSTIAAPLARMLNDTLRSQPYDAAFGVADYIRANIPPDALIETWEKELSVITDHVFHYPSQLIELRAGDDLLRDDADSSEMGYNFLDYVTPDYVIAGPFSKWVGVYHPDDLEQLGYRLVFTHDAYDIYQRR